MTSLAGKTAIVTGGARGIGAAIVERFVSEGMRVAAFDLNPPAPPTNGLSRRVDVADEKQVTDAVAETVDIFGRIDVLVNCAAADGIRGAVTEMTLDGWNLVMAANLTGAFLMSRAAIPAMASGEGGAIINVASQLGSVAVPANPAYCASKGGLIQLTRAMALDHAAEGIRVNALSPGAVLTERLVGVYGSESAVRDALTGKYPLGRIGMPDDLVGAAVFLASDESRFMTGADLVVDGGYSAQ
ncbi:MAG: SDR family oxidoreductase [Paracoccaceae bacterium]|nr:SDR family oxidoreductase [Paracoccaceae bacterium]